jgi:hypothetical protein
MGDRRRRCVKERFLVIGLPMFSEVKTGLPVLAMTTLKGILCEHSGVACCRWWQQLQTLDQTVECAGVSWQIMVYFQIKHPARFRDWRWADGHPARRLVYRWPWEWQWSPSGENGLKFTFHMSDGLSNHKSMAGGPLGDLIICRFNAVSWSTGETASRTVFCHLAWSTRTVWGKLRPVLRCMISRVKISK